MFVTPHQVQGPGQKKVDAGQFCLGWSFAAFIQDPNLLHATLRTTFLPL